MACCLVGGGGWGGLSASTLFIVPVIHSPSGDRSTLHIYTFTIHYATSPAGPVVVTDGSGLKATSDNGIPNSVSLASNVRTASLCC